MYNLESNKPYILSKRDKDRLKIKDSRFYLSTIVTDIDHVFSIVFSQFIS